MDGTSVSYQSVIISMTDRCSWAQASTAPNRLYKHYTTEGGIRVPFVMRYPGFTQHAPGTVCHAFTTAMDILPTFLDLAAIGHPNPNPAHPRAVAPYHDRHVYPMRGKSWVPYFRDGIAPRSSKDTRTDQAQIHESIYGDEGAIVAWEHYGKAAIRNGQWKIVNMPTEHPTGTGQWELYDMYSDQGETRDLAAEKPEVVRDLLEEWKKWLAETGTHYTTPLTTNEE